MSMLQKVLDKIKRTVNPKSKHKITAPWPVSTNSLYQGVKRLTPKARKYKEFLSNRLKSPKKSLTTSLLCVYTLYKKTKGTYDVSNFVKCFEDCITEAKFWEDDSQVDTIIITKGGVDKENPRIELEIYGVEEDGTTRDNDKASGQ